MLFRSRFVCVVKSHLNGVKNGQRIGKMLNTVLKNVSGEIPKCTFLENFIMNLNIFFDGEIFEKL